MAGYIGSKASVVSSGTERKRVFDITTTTTSLTGLAYTPNQVNVFHNGVRLVDGTDFTATNGSTITLTTAAESGDQVVVIASSSFQVADAVPASGGTFTGVVEFDNTSHIKLPAGTTAQRPSVPENGMIRYNTDLNYVEEYRGNIWQALSNAFSATGGTENTYSEGGNNYKSHTFTSSGTFTINSGTAEVEYLILAGGAGGGTDANNHGGGGGAGGMVVSSATLSSGSYSVTVGAGGSGSTSDFTPGSNGSNSSFNSVTAIGGGGGGTQDSNGIGGGSGGGAGGGGLASSGGSGTSGQGNAGGNNNGGSPYTGGGGGGKGTAGVAGGSAGSGNGGSGASNTYSTGSSVIYAAGGGGAEGGLGGSGGIGGNASASSGGSGTNAIVNRGSGGGGGSDGGSGGNGSSGIVVIRYQI